MREARLGASLNHPNLVAIYDTAIDDEGVLIVMEYVEGESLSQALRGGPLAAGRAWRDGVGAGRRARPRPRPRGGPPRREAAPTCCSARTASTKLADLGIATAADQTRITRSDIVLGTASYMAPEQLDGAEAGPAADVYALAAVCFEALAGREARTGAPAGDRAAAIGHRAAARPPRPPARAPAAAADVLPARRSRATRRSGRPRRASWHPGSRDALERPAPSPTVRHAPDRGAAPPPPRRRSTAAPAAGGARRRPRCSWPPLPCSSPVAGTRRAGGRRTAEQAAHGHRARDPVTTPAPAPAPAEPEPPSRRRRRAAPT